MLAVTIFGSNRKYPAKGPLIEADVPKANFFPGTELARGVGDVSGTFEEKHMVQNILETPSIQRLSGLLRSRYGKGLEINFMVDTASQVWDMNDYSVSSGDLYIPISQKESFLGMAKVPNVKDLPSSSVQAIAEIVKLILEPALYRKLLETKLEVAEARTSVINQSQSAQIILLCSKNPHLISKASILLHENGNRWALLQYADLGSKFGSAEELRNLGKASIFIPDLLLLSPYEIEVLIDFLNNSDAEVHPRIVIGSTRSWGEILDSDSMDLRLQDFVSPYVADLDRWSPDMKTMQETFNLLLQSAKAAQDNRL